MGRDVCVFKTAMGGTKALYCILTSDFSGPDLGYISITVQKLRFNLSWILLEYMLHVLRPGLQMLPIPSFYSKGAETRSRSMWSEIPAILLSFLPFFLPALLRIPRQLVRLTSVKFLRTSAMTVSKKSSHPFRTRRWGSFRYGAGTARGYAENGRGRLVPSIFIKKPRNLHKRVSLLVALELSAESRGGG